MAEPTEASAAICFDEVVWDVEISVPGNRFAFFVDYTTMLKLAAAPPSCSSRTARGAVNAPVKDGAS
jgi:hypothetical protein